MITSSGSPESALTVGQVEDVVYVGEQGIHVVGHEEDRDPPRPADPGHQGYDFLGVADIQAGQRLVQEKELRVGDQGLGQEEPLALSA